MGTARDRSTKQTEFKNPTLMLANTIFHGCIVIMLGMMLPTIKIFKGVVCHFYKM